MYGQKHHRHALYPSRPLPLPTGNGVRVSSSTFSAEQRRCSFYLHFCYFVLENHIHKTKHAKRLLQSAVEARCHSPCYRRTGANILTVRITIYNYASRPPKVHAPFPRHLTCMWICPCQRLQKKKSARTVVQSALPGTMLIRLDHLSQSCLLKSTRSPMISSQSESDPIRIR